MVLAITISPCVIDLSGKMVLAITTSPCVIDLSGRMVLAITISPCVIDLSGRMVLAITISPCVIDLSGRMVLAITISPWYKFWGTHPEGEFGQTPHPYVLPPFTLVYHDFKKLFWGRRRGGVGRGNLDIGRV